MSKKIPLSVSLVIPLFNNEKTAIAQINNCKDLLSSLVIKYEILLCDDKSTDQTARLLKINFDKKNNFRLILHKKNQGIAKTVYSLYKMAKNKYIVFFSVDGDWNTQDIGRLIKKIHSSDADIVIGQRIKSNKTLYRKIISSIYNFLPTILFGVNTIDAGSIKIIKKEMINKIPIISRSVFFEAELIIRAVRNGYKVTSIPISHIKRERRSGSGGKFSLILSSLVDLIRLKFDIT